MKRLKDYLNGILKINACQHPVNLFVTHMLAHCQLMRVSPFIARFAPNFVNSFNDE